MKHLSIGFLFLSLFLNEEQALDDLSLNKVQVIGSHNSYKQAIDPALFDLLKQKDSVGAKSIEYSHVSLSEQLSLGLRNLEIDFYADTEGEKYASPKGLSWTGKDRQRPYDPKGVMNKPGFKVLHMQDVDFRSSCLRLKDCLEELRSWSDNHKDHYPVFITLNAKDDLGDFPDLVIPEKFTSKIFDQLDQLIVETLGSTKVITPNAIRGKAVTLEAGVLKGQWPTMGESKNKFIFILDEVGEKQATYIEGHPS